MKVIKVFYGDTDTLYGWRFQCPACNCGHFFCTNNIIKDNHPLWTFNGNVDKPTFTPSLRLSAPANEEKPAYCCHSIVTDGMIAFCGDCTHAMAGQTVELPDIPESSEEL